MLNTKIKKILFMISKNTIVKKKVKGLYVICFFCYI